MLRQGQCSIITAAALVLVLTIGASGCGGGSSSSGGDSVSANTSSVAGNTAKKLFPPQIVRDSEIKAQKKGSPERALLQWWQAFQFSDAAGVVALTSPQTLKAVGKQNLTKLVQIRGPGTQGIKLLGTSTAGDTATMRVALLTFQPKQVGAQKKTVYPSVPSTSMPESYAFTKVNGRWLYASTGYLANLILNSNL
jgi:hypothetical protein